MLHMILDKQRDGKMIAKRLLKKSTVPNDDVEVFPNVNLAKLRWKEKNIFWGTWKELTMESFKLSIGMFWRRTSKNFHSGDLEVATFQHKVDNLSVKTRLTIE